MSNGISGLTAHNLNSRDSKITDFRKTDRGILLNAQLLRHHGRTGDVVQF